MAVHQALAADLLLINGRLLTMDAHHTVAQAVAVKDGKIVLVGANAEVESLAGAATRVIEVDEISRSGLFSWPIFPWNVGVRRERGRALGLLWNFCLSSPGTVKKYEGQKCPAERLNGQRYADSWLENLLISGSMNGVEMDQQNPL